MFRSKAAGVDEPILSIMLVRMDNVLLAEAEGPTESVNDVRSLQVAVGIDDEELRGLKIDDTAAWEFFAFFTKNDGRRDGRA